MKYNENCANDKYLYNVLLCNYYHLSIFVKGNVIYVYKRRSYKIFFLYTHLTF